MADLALLVSALAFFVLCWAYVWGCERIVAAPEESHREKTKR